MTPRTIWCVAGFSSTLLAAGWALSHQVEPGVSIRKGTIATDIPGLRFTQVGPGPHPVALLAHGAFCSKEMLFRYGEAMAHAGFDCVSIDLPGHGESSLPFLTGGLANSLALAARAIGPVDVFIGHSMGGYDGGVAVREAGFSPRLFVAIGSLPSLGEQGPPLLLMSGQWDEFIRPAWVRARTDARVELFPWCDHVFELYDSRLVDAAVEAACLAVGKLPPDRPTRWRWRLAGLALGSLGAFGLAVVALVVCQRSAPSARLRGPLFAVLLIGAAILVTGTWIGAMPHLRRLPWQIGAGVVVWLVVTGLGKLGLPQWSLAASVSLITLVGVIAMAGSIMLLGSLFSLALLAGTVCAAVVARGGSKRDGALALAIVAGYVIGQWAIMPF